jgi:hypothetical protein
VALWNKPRFAVVKDDRAAGDKLQLLDQVQLVSACRVNVQGCCGVHGIASLCGEE